ncbi:MAG: Gfo/Idh/MocA family oxidoreductase [Verrucomicrobiae bacterium]|nr:Gfo/Idh/MocA family oxidoreductase [Verrucomicrobiae bacterium]
MNRTSRRHFLKTAAGAAVAPAIVSSSVLGTKARAAASERITFGVIGVGGRGFADMEAFLKMPDTQVVAVCDVDSIHYGKNAGRQGRAWGRDAAKLTVDMHYEKAGDQSYKGCDTYSDFRELCARDDIDAIVVATPDHWHALATLEALKSGKDVYCEKPVTHFFAEGQAVYREVAKQNAIFQVGSQQRSTANFHQGVELILNGVIGKVKEVKVGLPQGHNEPDGDPAFTDPPEHLDYEFWTGPSQMLPYTRARNHWSWRWHRNYGGGQLMDWIGHHNDISHWGLGMDKSGPVSVSTVGWTWPETDIYNSPVDYEVRCEYPGGIQVSIGSVNPMGTKWIGEDGWVYVNRGKIEASNPAWLEKGFKAGDKTAYRSENHHGNFLEGVKTRKECICPAETGHRSITPGHLAYVANDLKREVLKWDAAKEQIVGDDEAQARLMALPYRAPWEFPA